MDAYVSRPDGAPRVPAVVVVQEAYGVNGHIRDVCDRFAREGYLAVAPELFHREGRGVEVPYSDMESALRHLRVLTNEGLEMDLAAAFQHARSRSEVRPGEVGIVGFCVGGLAAFIAACRLAPDATVSFYGGGIARPRPQFKLQPVLREARGIRAPILCLFGAEDQGIPPEDVAAIRDALDGIQAAHEVVVYPGAGHAFFSDARPSYHAPSAADAWRRTLDWLGRHVRRGA
ncbi:MAG TPA: dienelactone hydrolase family protein [Candidatus Eisenbacteria bacterium]